MLLLLASLAFAPPIVIAHRGASGERPEHTLAAYQLALEQGADFIEPDLVITKDGVLVCRHENEISATTDVASKLEFAGRKKTKTIDGVTVQGWFTEDFTLQELKTLRAKERVPDLRKGNAAFDGKFEIPTFEEVLAMLREWNRGGKVVGIYPETKHSTYFATIDLPLEKPLIDLVKKYGYDKRDAPIFIQSFERSNLKMLRRGTKARLIQLIDAGTGQPFDSKLAESKETYAQMVTPAGLANIATYADGIGVNKEYLFTRTEEGGLGPATTVVEDAHKAGLLIHAWTFRMEDVFLPKDLVGKPEEELKRAIATGIDGLFTDFPGWAVKVRGT